LVGLGAIVSAEELLRESASRLAWMKSLESFVLIKLGSSAAFAPGQRVDSPFLHILVHCYLFPRLEENPLRRFWVQDFEVNLCAALGNCSPDSLQSYRSGDCGGRNENYESFCSIHHLGGSIGFNFSHPVPFLQKLEYASGFSPNDCKVLYIMLLRIRFLAGQINKNSFSSTNFARLILSL